jgi:hypothetical protein
MTLSNGSPPFPDGPVSDWTANTPRPTSPPPPRRTASPHPFQEVRESLIQDGRYALRKAIEKLFRAGLTHAEVLREVQAVMDKSGVPS